MSNFAISVVYFYFPEAAVELEKDRFLHQANCKNLGERNCLVGETLRGGNVIDNTICLRTWSLFIFWTSQEWSGKVVIHQTQTISDSTWCSPSGPRKKPVSK